MIKKVIIIGGRGNGTVIASTIEDCIEHGQKYIILGFLNDNETSINGYSVIGGIKEQNWYKWGTNVYFIFAMSNVKQSEERYEMLEKLKIPENRFITIIHPSSVVSKKAKLGNGVVIMPHALISPNVVLGNHTQCYAQSFVGHDTVVDEMVFIANNCSVGGRVTIEKGAHIGSNSSILERVTIGKFSVIGLASNVLKSTESKGVYVGNPAKKIKSL
ncbi:NeuD/PglB/VioB family sugar acetyltransferase [Verrucomicrobia bacterium]|jgi:acetyltransferase EpsM|nr:NeuD/PglB/VioB family sugar acetyltransferase [Verrucomicrobiota bacterium]